MHWKLEIKPVFYASIQYQYTDHEKPYIVVKPVNKACIQVVKVNNLIYCYTSNGQNLRFHSRGFCMNGDRNVSV